MTLVVTTSPLLATITFSSSIYPVEPNQSRLSGTVFADAAGTLFIEQSDDGANFDISTNYGVTASTGVGFNEDIVANFWRIRFTNGNSPQGAFRLYAKPRTLAP